MIRHGHCRSGFIVVRWVTAAIGDTLAGKQMLVLTVGALGMASLQVHTQQGVTQDGWRYWGGDSGVTKYSALDQIRPANVKGLRIVWRRPAVDAVLTNAFPDLAPSPNLRATPIMIDGVLYAPNGVGLLEAFHAGTGKTIRVQEPFEPGMRGVAGQSTRGAAYWRVFTEVNAAINPFSVLMLRKRIQRATLASSAQPSGTRSESATDVRACAPPSRPSPTAGPAQAAPRTSLCRERSENRKRPNFIGLQPGSISETAAFTSAKSPIGRATRKSVSSLLVASI